jgi:hypothetical protein
MAKQYKITKASDPKLVGVIFECAILNNSMAPKWFVEFVVKQFKPFVSNVETRLTNLEIDMKDVKSRLSTVEDVLKRNNLK